MAPPADHIRRLLLLGNALRRRRKSLGISQEDLADRAGLHRTYVSDVERGTRNVSVKNLFRLAAALRMPASALIRSAEAEKGTR